MLNLSKIAALGALLGFSALAAIPASAAPVTLVFSGLGTGIVHGNGFNSAPFSFSYATDTDLFSFNGSSPALTTYPNAAPVSVSVKGYGSGTSTNPAYFSFLPDASVFALTDSTTGSYVFAAQATDFPKGFSIPITLPDQNQYSSYKLSPFETSIGEIQFAEIHDATFSLGRTAPVPEASSVVSLALLLTLGAGTLAVAVRRKKAAV